MVSSLILKVEGPDSRAGQGLEGLEMWSAQGLIGALGGRGLIIWTDSPLRRQYGACIGADATLLV